MNRYTDSGYMFGPISVVVVLRMACDYKHGTSRTFYDTIRDVANRTVRIGNVDPWVAGV